MATSIAITGMGGVKFVTQDEFDRACKVALFATIRVNSKVSITNRFNQVHSGRAVMRGPAGWVLNMGGPHGTPGIATTDNVVAVKGGR